jgi:hypothetical protein
MFKNVFAHPFTTICGLFLGVFQGAIGAAAAAYTQTGNVTDWKPYATAAAIGATTALVGAVMKDPSPPLPMPLAFVDTPINVATSAPPTLPTQPTAPIISPEVATAMNDALIHILGNAVQKNLLLRLPDTPPDTSKG